MGYLRPVNNANAQDTPLAATISPTRAFPHVKKSADALNIRRLAALFQGLSGLAAFLALREAQPVASLVAGVIPVLAGLLSWGAGHRDGGVRLAGLVWLLTALAGVLFSGGFASPLLALFLVAPVLMLALGRAGIAAEMAAWALMTLAGMAALSGLGWLPGNAALAGAGASAAGRLALLLVLGLALLAGLRLARARRDDAEEPRLPLPALLVSVSPLAEIREVSGRLGEGPMLAGAVPGQALRHLAAEPGEFARWFAALPSGGARQTVFAASGDGTLLQATALPGAGPQEPWRILLQPASARPDLEARAAAAEAALAERTAFFASLGHDLKTPLNAIIGFSDMMRGAWLGPLSDNYRERASLIHESGQDLLLLIEDMLDLARAEAGQSRLDAEPVDLSASARAVMRQLSDVAARRSIRLRLARSPGVWAQADARAIRQIWQNLLSNAIKYSDEGGDVLAGAVERDGQAVLFVADRGIGMSEDDLARIATPFTQGRNAHGRAGTGLGLAVVRRFAELHGGRVRIDTAPGKGTRVEVSLPLAPGFELAAEQPRAAE